MIASLQKTVRTAGVRGLFDGISGTWMRQMSYSVCRFWAYDESKKIVGAGACCVFLCFLALWFADFVYRCYRCYYYYYPRLGTCFGRGYG